jgi:hypothetical protein
MDMLKRFKNKGSGGSSPDKALLIIVPKFLIEY